MPTSPAELSVRPQPFFLMNGVAAGYGGSRVVDGITAQVGLGEIATIIGPNGSGKSTLLKAVTGDIPLLAGTVSIGGKDVTGLRRDQLVRAGVGYVPQEREVFAPLTVRENLEMGGYLLKRSQVPQAMDRVFALFGDLARMLGTPAGRLSGGERKMLALGRVLMHDPTVVVLDEPTANLSPIASNAVLAEQVPALAAAGKAVLLVEQRALDALNVSDWAYVMVAGSLRVEAAARDMASRGDIGEMFLGRSITGPGNGRDAGPVSGGDGGH
jgi:ABC-type branched-subunit amino acid transport system ATPase component